MNTRLLLRLLFTALAMKVSASVSHAGPVSTAFSQASHTSVLIKVQYGCGWRYTCSGANGSPQVNIYGPVNVYTNRGSTGWWPSYGDSWRGGGRYDDWRDGGNGNWQGGGMSCGGNWPCDEKCGFLCWYRRIRAGYCGHGCDWYRERVSFYGSGDRFTPYVSSANGYASQFNNDSGGYAGGWDPGYSQGSSNGYGSSSYSQGGGERPSDYPQDQQAQDRGYDPSASAPRRERIVDRIRRYFSITPRQERRESSTVHFERPLNGEAVPLKRFNGPKYPPDCSGRNC